jgi:asparagine synthase (glutamine-hydrolysing)
MCGIAGEITFGSHEPDREAVTRMLARMTHRGPDDFGLHVEKGLVLGHRRLTIIDLSDQSSQPMVDAETGVALTFNGEIYNYVELRSDLAALGHIFSTSGDTEVLLRAWLEWGEGALDRLNGMFAFAIVDLRRRRALFARDPVGQKPLFYRHYENGFVFASELQALLEHPRVPRSVNPNSVCQYLVYEGFVDDACILDGVSRLPPGTMLLIDLDSGQSQQRQYWASEPRNHATVASDPGPADMDALETVLREAVSRHLRSDVPVGVYLSGGIDSNLIATLACDMLPPESINTFTVRHSEKSFDEADQAKWTAERLGTTHREMLLTSELLLESVPRILDTLDEPLADPGLVSIYQIANFASQHVKVVLSGDGGDEFFYGYAPFHKWQLSERIAAMPRWVSRGMMRPMIDRLPAQFGYMGTFYKAQVFARGFGLPESIRNMAWLGAFDAAELRELIRDGGDLDALRTDDEGIAGVYGPSRAIWDAASELEPLERLALEYQKVYLPSNICAHTDKANMMHSLEARSPLLDPTVMRAANALPSSWKMQGGVGKWILRRYLTERLGTDVGQRAKRGFTVPLAHWLRGPLRPLVEDLLSPDAIRVGGLFDPEAVAKIWRAHLEGKRNNYKKLWALVVFQSWQRRVLEV